MVHGLIYASWRDTEAVVRWCSVKKVCLIVWQNSQENTCVGVSFLIKVQARGLQFIKKTIIQHMRFSANFAKLLGTPFFMKNLRWLYR